MRKKQNQELVPSSSVAGTGSDEKFDTHQIIMPQVGSPTAHHHSVAELQRHSYMEPVHGLEAGLLSGYEMDLILISI